MLSNEQLERYSRHIILKEVGAKGQKKLLNAKVLIIGAGGLGAPAAMYLAAAGVGTIGIADADEVDLSNLQRQIIHSTQDVGKAKVQSAKETMEAINPDVKVITYRTFVDSESIMDLIKDYDFSEYGTAPSVMDDVTTVHFNETVGSDVECDVNADVYFLLQILL